MPGTFKLNHLQHEKPILFFILGGQFLLPQWTNNGKIIDGHLKISHYHKREKQILMFEAEGLAFMLLLD